jgi:hypothetical protein
MVNSELDNTAPGDNLVTLREALVAANNDSTTDLGETGNGADEIVFDSSLAGKTIVLGGTQLEISSDLTLTGLGASQLTVDGNNLSRVLEISSGTTVKICGITLTHGVASAGGGLLSAGTTTLRHVKVVDNMALANGPGFVAANGGGIANSGEMRIEDSIVSGNTSFSRTTTTTAYSSGGGIFSVPPTSSAAPISLTIIRSTVSGNTATSTSDSFSGSGRSLGGGIFSGTNNSFAVNALAIYDSTISNNLASSLDGNGNRRSSGGGINAGGPVTIARSAIYGNSATSSTDGFNAWSRSDGGGISFVGNLLSFPNGFLSIFGSTVSGNSVSNSGGGSPSYSRGGGISINGSAEVAHSTITANTATAGQGGGVFDNDTMGNEQVFFKSSIVYGNANSDIDDLGLTQFFTRIVSTGYNIVGSGNALGSFTKTGDHMGTTDPMLDDLADNGGLSLTHALLPGSPAINTGDPAVPANPNEFDQRGAPYLRVVSGRIDTGAFEVQAVGPPALLGDYNRSGLVDAADYTVWRDALGQNGLTPFSGADGNGNGAIDAGDYAVWKTHFGQTLPVGTGTALAAQTLLISEAVSPAIEVRPLAESLSTSEPARRAPAYWIAPATVRSPSIVKSSPSHQVTDAGLLAYVATQRTGRHVADVESIGPPSRDDAEPLTTGDELWSSFAKLALFR